MKIYIIVALLSVNIFSTSCFSADGLTELEILDKFVRDTNKEYESFFSIKNENVVIDKSDIDRNGSVDLMVYYDGRCGSAKGCEMDVYLCLSATPSCETNRYCYAGIFSEGQVERNKDSIKCIN